jgi:hypothetical protein
MHVIDAADGLGSVLADGVGDGDGDGERLMGLGVDSGAKVGAAVGVATGVGLTHPEIPSTVASRSRRSAITVPSVHAQRRAG